MADTNIDTPTEAVSPSGINHLVLNVRDIDESHKFWTEIVGPLYADAKVLRAARAFEATQPERRPPLAA